MKLHCLNLNQLHRCYAVVLNSCDVDKLELVNPNEYSRDLF